MADSKTDNSCWIKRWENNEIGFHKIEVNPMLIKHKEQLIPDGTTKKVFVPLCGKSLDLKWLADQGMQTVGIDVAELALEQFFTENGLEWDETPAPQLGETGKVLCSKDGMIKLYCGDMMKFSVDLEGTFDATWDRASIVALKREDLKKYANVMKSVLKPGGRILVELLQYNAEEMETMLADVTCSTKPPPPFPTYEEDLKKLYEPECSIQFVDKQSRKLMGQDITAVICLIIKK